MSDLLERIQAEIAARRAELEPHLEEYRQLLAAADALGLTSAEQSSQLGKRAAQAPKPAKARTVSKRPAKAKAQRRSQRSEPASAASARSPRGAAQTAILAALEHGSHTVSELGVVTALSGQIIRENLRRLLGSGAVTRAKREGKAAYALTTSAH